MALQVKCDMCKKKKDLKTMKPISVGGKILKVCKECFEKINGGKN